MHWVDHTEASTLGNYVYFQYRHPGYIYFDYSSFRNWLRNLVAKVVRRRRGIRACISIAKEQRVRRYLSGTVNRWTAWLNARWNAYCSHGSRKFDSQVWFDVFSSKWTWTGSVGRTWARSPQQVRNDAILPRHWVPQNPWGTERSLRRLLVPLSGKKSSE